MTEEEKKAIAYLKFYLNDDKNDYFDKDFIIEKKDLQIVLNLIQKQDTEIKKLKDVIDRMAEKINQAYFDESNMWLWFEKEICPKNKDGKYDFKDLGTRKKRIKEYFMKEDK